MSEMEQTWSRMPRHQCWERILLSILGEGEQGRSVLNESVTYFRRALDDDDTGMARLPLIIFLDILLVLFRSLPFQFETSTLQRWKKSVYKGSLGFFDDFVTLLEGLPHYIHAKCSEIGRAHV